MVRLIFFSGSTTILNVLKNVDRECRIKWSDLLFFRPHHNSECAENWTEKAGRPEKRELQ